MKKLLTLLALAGLSAAAGACGDDSGDDGDKDPAKPDAAVKTDAATPPREVQITNVGAACTADTDCKGPGAVECLTEFGSAQLGGVQELEGGYCTAQCNATAECGTNGTCLVAELLASPTIAQFANSIPGGIDIVKSLIPSNCLLSCTVGDAGGRGTCTRPEHLCRKLLPDDAEAPAGMQPGGFDIASIAGNVPALNATYCLPEIEIGSDAGVRPDGGAALRLSGLDAGI